MVVLKEPIANAKISPIRLDEPIKKGETLTAIGWGVTDTTTTPEIRQQRSGIKIEGIGPDDTNAFPVPPNEFEVGESICSGDSGGPALASTKAIVGVVSRGGNATQPDPQNPASSCIGGNNLYTKVAPFKSFILSGLALVGAEPWLENGPDPRLAKTGETCTAGSDCRSNLCARDPEGKGTPKCVDDCSVNACPDDMTCKVEGDVSLCRPPTAEPAANATTTTTTTGCAAAPGSSSPAGALGFVLAALGLVAVRRRRA
jgi:MYXO-CTERM domain-containing protein